MNKKSPYTITPTTDLAWESLDTAIFTPPRSLGLVDKIKFVALELDTKWPEINQIMLSEKVASSSPSHRKKQKVRAMRSVYEGRDKNGGFKYRMEVIY